MLSGPAGTDVRARIVTGPRSRVEYVGGPRDGTSDELDELPQTVALATGRYVRSVRCAEDGAMRYVWRDSTETTVDQRIEPKGDRDG
jgi:hypothetical protein